MPFQIQNIAAYREEVLDELRRQAKLPGTETYEIVKSNPGSNSDGYTKYDKAVYDRLENAQGCYDTFDKLLWYCYAYMPLHFNALQRIMQLEELAANDPYGDTFRKKILRMYFKTQV